ncbi:MAG: hypothetical protein Q9187_008000 [Circinaria calcarea]
MNNRWSRQLQVIHQGHIVQDNAVSRDDAGDQLGNFSWLMVALVTVLDVCLPTNDTRDLLIGVFVTLLQRDDVQDLTESFQMQLQTNIESWRSFASVRGMVAHLSAAIRDCRSTLARATAIPPLTRGEKQELRDFLIWLMDGKTNHYRLVSATLYSLVEALHCAGIQLETGPPGQTVEGRVTIQYVGQVGGSQEFFDIVESDLDFLKIHTENGMVPQQRVSYLSGNPSQMIEAFPRPVAVKNQMAKFWALGELAGAKVALRAMAPLRTLGVLYDVRNYDECVSRWDGILLVLAGTHFPVDSETVMSALNDLMSYTPESLQKWLMGCANRTLRVEELKSPLTEQQIDLFLSYQSLVFGYWYKLLEPWVSMEFVPDQVYFYSVWGLRDVYLMQMLRRFTMKLQMKSTYAETATKVDLLRVLAVMYCGRHTYEPDNTAQKLEREEIVRFAIVALPVIGLLPNQSGELWAGDTAGIQFQSCQNPTQQLMRKRPQKGWSVHAKMSTTDGRLNKVVMVARCDGIVVGTFNPAEAEGNLLRARANKCGNFGPRMALSRQFCERRRPTPLDPATETPESIFDVTEEQFQTDIISQPFQHSQIVVVHSHGCPAMRYAAIGFYAQESHVVFTGKSLEESIKAIREQFTQLLTRYMSGIIVD